MLFYVLSLILSFSINFSDLLLFFIQIHVHICVRTPKTGFSIFRINIAGMYM